MRRMRKKKMIMKNMTKVMKVMKRIIFTSPLYTCRTECLYLKLRPKMFQKFLKGKKKLPKS